MTLTLMPDWRCYPSLIASLKALPEQQAREMARELGRKDLYFLLRYLLHREDVEATPLRADWVFARCREVQAAPDNYLDLWAREHYKSTIITLTLTIQSLLVNPELTIAIFSHTRDIAKSFLRQIKEELETNRELIDLYPDVLWEDANREAPTWSLDGGIKVKRKGNPNPSSCEAWGVVDSQPTGKHFDILVYDDLVTIDSVNTPDAIRKVTDRWALSLNLGTEGGVKRYAGTIYAFNDTYREMRARKAAKERIYPCTVDGTFPGVPVMMAAEELAERHRAQGPFVFSTQMLLDPKAMAVAAFDRNQMNYYENDLGAGRSLNTYILVDPANSKKKSSDYTAMFVIGLSGDRNYYILDMVRDRLNLGERWEALLELHQKYKPLGVGYERYGKDSDIQHFQSEMQRLTYRFSVTELGGIKNKNDRIRRLIPLFAEGRIWFPKTLWKDDWEGNRVDLVQDFVEEEFVAFPVGVHDDMLDALARMLDENFTTRWPKGPATDAKGKPREKYTKRPARRRQGSSGWGA
jgi:predicted phage terminase large subunit-like protein